MGPLNAPLIQVAVAGRGMFAGFVWEENVFGHSKSKHHLLCCKKSAGPLPGQESDPALGLFPAFLLFHSLTFTRREKNI